MTALMEKEYPQLALDHHLVDSAAMLMVANPRKLNGVLVTENLFGDMYVCLFRYRSHVRFTNVTLITACRMKAPSSPAPSVSCLPPVLPAPQTPTLSLWVSMNR